VKTRAKILVLVGLPALTVLGLSQSTPQNANGIEFVKIQPGEFMMGCSTDDFECNPDEKPRHRVQITKGFELGKYEITQAQWVAIVQSNPSGGKGDNRPVENVSKFEAQEFIAKLNAKNDGYRYRLPTEAEWEYAARAGTTTKYWWGDDVGKAYANCSDCGGPWDRKAPTLVDAFEPNGLGLYGTSGAEWVADCWVRNHAGVPADGKPRIVSPCGLRVLRGGSWRNAQDDVTSASRLGYDGSVRYYTNGFRVARDLE
jgi:formylglycine-generating enzyme required for sulfatase activity